MIIRLILSLILFQIFFSQQVMAQELIDIEDRIAWQMAQDGKPTNNTIVFTPQFNVETTRGKVYSNLLNLFTGGSYDRVLRLLDGDTILLIGIPDYDPRSNLINPLFAARYLVNDVNKSFLKLDDFTIGYGKIFGEEVYRDMQMQKPLKPYFRKIEVKIFANDPEGLHITLTDGDYGSAMLIYTPLSAKPIISVQ